MNPNPAPPRELNVKRYPNRRFYDATRSRHVTLSELYDLVSKGFTIRVSDSETGHDITNVVLTQMILDHEAEKLAIFPSEILHALIRTRQQFLGTVVEDFFRHTLAAQRAVQEQWAQFLERAALPPAMPPLSDPADWVRAMTQAFTKSPSAGSPPPGTAHVSAAAPTSPPLRPEAGAAGEPGDVEALKRQVEELSRRIDELSRKPRGARPRKPRK